MRWLIGLVIAATTLWSGYWFVSARGLEAGLESLAEVMRQDGWQIDYSSVNVRGFPNRLDTNAEDLRLAPPGQTFRWQAPFLQTMALSYRPNHIVAVWPHEQSLSTPSGDFDLTSEDMRASFVVRPETSLPLDRATLVIAAPAINSAAGWQVSSEYGRLALKSLEGRDASYELGAEFANIRLPEIMAKGMPRDVELVRVDAELTLDRSLDRFAFQQDRPRLTAIDLKPSQAEWGGMELQASGSLSIGLTGIPEGTVQLVAMNWQPLLDAAMEAELITPEQIAQARLALTLLSAQNGSGQLRVPLVFSKGLMSLGPVPLGPAPRLR